MNNFFLKKLLVVQGYLICILYLPKELTLIYLKSDAKEIIAEEQKSRIKEWESWKFRILLVCFFSMFLTYLNK